VQFRRANEPLSHWATDCRRRESK